MSAQFAVLKKGFGLAATIIYAIFVLGCGIFTFTDVESHAGVLITCALIALIPLAYIVYGSGLIPDPQPPNADGPTGSQLRARAVVAHCLLFAALIVFPLRTAPVLSGFLILLIVALVFVGLAYKTPKDNEVGTKDSLKKLDEWIKPSIAVVIGLIFLFGAFYSLHIGAHTEKAVEIAGQTEMSAAIKNGDILEMMALKYKELTSKRSSGNWDAEERRIRSASFNLIPRNDQTGSCDPLASEQRVVLHQEAPPTASPAALPGFIASVNSWRRPVDFTLGRTDTIALSPDSYININTPADSVYIMLLASQCGAGADLVLENGICKQSGNQYECSGTWHQGTATGTYKMGVQETGATARLYAVVGGDSVQVCQITILVR